MAKEESIDGVVLCGSSAYTRKFYLDPKFERLPQGVKDELKIACVLFTAEIGGTIVFYFTEDGELMIETDAKENDFNYDEIGAALKVRKLRDERKDLLEGMELYYKVFVLGQDVEE